jgi:2-polyprenyl-6-methoxyphenol hydroxylase-like FAD-dependent oxidoreductase
MKIAISGAGVAGPTLAYWLLRGGHEPTLIEAAPQQRTGGYMIDFWGVGYAIAERMGLVEPIRAAGYPIQEVRYLDGRGKCVARISAETMRRGLGDRFTSLPRGDLAAILFAAVQDQMETLFGETVTRIEASEGEVRIELSGGRERAFDLVVGADGLRSNIRALAFGPDAEFERPLGYYVAAFECRGYRPRDELAYVGRGRAGRQVFRFAGRGDRTMFLFVFTAERLGGEETAVLVDRKAAIARVFAETGGEWPAISRALSAADEVYFDRVSQIVAGVWSKRRVALVGDAAAAVSLIAGEGTGLGMAEAYVLAGELAGGGELEDRLARYEARLRPFIEAKQAAARSFAGAFAPRTAFGLWLRNQAVRLMAIPGFEGVFLGPQMRDDLELPQYPL